MRSRGPSQKFIVMYLLTGFFLMYPVNLTRARQEVNKPPIKVYLLGTFHFAQTESSYDVLEDDHQKSIQQLCALIQSQNPDKVFIERMPDFEYINRMDSLYNAFKKGDSLTRRNEIWQVAFRVARNLGHDSVYSCDHPGQYGYYMSLIEEYAHQTGQLGKLNYKGSGMTAPLTDIINADSLRDKITLLEFIKWLNAPEVQRSSHASYINYYNQLGNTNAYQYDSAYFLGAKLTADWYRRNIMIYSKMLAQLNYTENAIFLLMGNDHIPIIRHLFESNPFFEVVPAIEWLGESALFRKE